MTTQYKYLSERERVQQHFDKDKIMLTKAGKTYNVYQAIQEAREDTEIMPTLLKYGCIDKLGMDPKAVYADITNIQNNLRNVIDQQIEAEKLWESLPIETRMKYNNSTREFMERAPEDLKKQIEEIEKQNKPIEQAVVTESEVKDE